MSIHQQESQANDGENAKDATATENGSEEADQKKDESTSEKPEEEKKKVEVSPKFQNVKVLSCKTDDDL